MMTDFNNSTSTSASTTADNLTADQNEEIVERLKAIAESGNVDVNWIELQQALKLRLTNVVQSYHEPGNDGYRDEILDLIASFTEPPFTIQRICELLYSPFKYYDKVDTFLRGLERNLRVISSIDKI